ncbi:spheroidene monooxygenase [Hymenobacter gelipurpurascens]|uniref:Spheroidene monooxygenase n=1 Tax=Hymenobacter gelipurpurascens TaxID=89968 RepID=A0A212T972_9BACT|nr:spheroidene monooxygenase [Hymenobacter gelipurpurascens]SNC62569.1 spheroidene monooxygenase [Hymenobacter gelipurpurascens]
MLTTLSILTLKPGNVRWGLAQMGTAQRPLQRVPGLRFQKLLGSGAGGFGALPNLHRYGFMAVWDSADAAEAFFTTHPLWQQYLERTQEIWTAQLAPIKSHGLWDGVNPFDYASEDLSPEGGPVAVLTRASIRWQKTPRFWRYVAPTSATIADAPGVRAAIGLGELPVVRQATVSLWESAQAMQDYAYRSEKHKEVIRLTRQEKWYGEELFARFRVLSTEGTWDGRTLLST